MQDEEKGTKVSIAEYDSQNNVFKGFVVIKADTVSEAQDKFISWLQKQPTYGHMWQLNFRIIGNDYKPFIVVE